MTASGGTGASTTFCARVERIPHTDRKQILDYAKGRSDIIDLARGDPDLPPPPTVLEAAHAALRNEATHYTEYNGVMRLRELIAERLQRKNGIAADPESEIVVTCGVQEGIFLALHTLLNDGDEVLIPSPHYASYFMSTLAGGGHPVFVPLREEDGFLPDVDALRRAVTPRTKALIFGNPVNPMGVVWPAATLREIAALARERDLWVIADEIYEDFRDVEYPGSIGALEGMKERAVVLNGFSKSHCMMGMRMGFLTAPAPLVTAISGLHYNLVLCPDSVSQQAAIAALECPPTESERILSIFAGRRALAREALAQVPGIACVSPTGAFYAFPNVSRSGLSAMEAAKALVRDMGVLTVPGTEFGALGEPYVRLSVCCPEEMLREGLRRVGEWAGRVM